MSDDSQPSVLSAATRSGPVAEDDLRTIAVPHDAPPTPSQWTANTRVGGQFELVRPLGEGGMGEVFLARDNQLGRLIALKTMRIPQGASGDNFEAFVRMFRRDAASTARLNHPRIVTCHQFGVHGSTPFMVMEYVQGQTLRRRLRQERLSVTRVIKWASDIADALAYAHEEGVIHRDLKPSNLVIDDSGHIKILDFGVALLKVERDQLMQDFGLSDAQLTSHLGASPDVAGTPSYMAPEQILGESQDERTDVWAFGVLLYEMLQGERPFRGREEVLEGELDWTFNNDVPPILVGLIRGCLSRDIQARPSDFKEVKVRLQASLQQSPATQTSDLTAGNLVPPGDHFVGRTDALEEAMSRLAVHQMMSVVGPGGVGKTRFATELALRYPESFDGTFFADLSDAQTLQGVLLVLANTLGIALRGADPEQTLLWALQSRGEPLLVLDNCEQIVEVMAEAIPRWMAHASSVRFVVTSREPLGVAGEQVLNLEPLNTQTQALLRSDAYQLFVARARESNPKWMPDGHEETLQSLVAELDGLPLAIELAAARVMVLPPAKMLERVRQQFDVLRSRRRDVPARQATLEGAIAWSWDLLDPTERGVLAQLSVFEAGFALEDAEGVVDVENLGGAPFVLDILEDLVLKSLVKYDADRDRFMLLNSIKNFAGRQLSADAPWVPDIPGWADSVRMRHCEYFAGLGSDGEPDVARLNRSKDNVFWALDYAVTHQKAELALQALRAFCVSVEYTGPFRLGVSVCERVLREVELEPAGRIAALNRLASFRRQLSDWDAACGIWEQIQEIANESADEAALAEVALNLGRVADRRGDYDRAHALFSEALSRAQVAGVERTMIGAHGNLGNVALDRGDYDGAEAGYKAAVNLAIQAGYRRGEGSWLGNLGIVEFYRGNYPEAQRYYEQAINICREVDDRKTESVWSGNLGDLELLTGNLEGAELNYRGAAEFARHIGARFEEGVALGRLGVVETHRQRTASAISYLTQAREIARELGNKAFEGRWAGYLGRAYLEENLFMDAQDALGEALEIAEEIGDKRHAAIWIGWQGLVHEGLGDFDAARECFTQANAISTEIGDNSNSVVWRLSLGIIDASTGRLEEARQVLDTYAQVEAENVLEESKIRRRLDRLSSLLEKPN